MIEPAIDSQETTPHGREPGPDAAFVHPTTLRAVGRYWYLVLLCAVLAAAAGGVFAFKRPPVYQATARMSAVSLNVANAASVAGSLQAGQELASAFARVAQSTPVTNAVAKALNTTPIWASAHVNATPIADSPSVAINANASTSAVAVKAANAALRALTKYARNLTQLPPKSPLLDSVRSDAIQLSQAQTHLNHLKTESQSQTLTQTTPDASLQRQIDSATAQVTQAQTRLSGDQGAYTQQSETEFAARSQITTTKALSGTSDRTKVAQIAILLGLLVGLVVGVAAATALASRRARRVAAA